MVFFIREANLRWRAEERILLRRIKGEGRENAEILKPGPDCPRAPPGGAGPARWHAQRKMRLFNDRLLEQAAIRLKERPVEA
jgi:hypothetical protein